MTNLACPIVAELSPLPDVEELFQRLSVHPHCLFLDSAQRDPILGRYSFLAADPFVYVERTIESSDSLGELAGLLAAFHARTVAGLPPFQGGAAVMLSYDLGRQLERLPSPSHDEFQAPAIAIGLYDVVIAVDHVAGRGWIVSQGFPESEPGRRRERAERRLAEVQDWLRCPATVPDDRRTRPVEHGGRRSPVQASELAMQFPVSGLEGLTSNFTESTYLQAVRRVIEYIRAGDVFQVNLAQRLLYPAQDDPVQLYLRLRRRNPAPFAGYFDLNDFSIVSASPERFLSVRDGLVEARPIKGTRRRTAQPEADLFAGDELRESPKDRAENVMIVDLLRNDLSRVCRPESVHVSHLCGLEAYQYVQHLVSVVRGCLRADRRPLDAVHVAFPGGSVTGAPKIRAMEIIAELEPTARGPYCGSLGYIGFDGTLDLSILIRTITAGRGWWQAPVGGGIVAQSRPDKEYEETWHKAEGLVRALRE